MKFFLLLSFFFVETVFANQKISLLKNFEILSGKRPTDWTYFSFDQRNQSSERHIFYAHVWTGVEDLQTGLFEKIKLVNPYLYFDSNMGKQGAFYYQDDKKLVVCAYYDAQFPYFQRETGLCSFKKTVRTHYANGRWVRFFELDLILK